MTLDHTHTHRRFALFYFAMFLLLPTHHKNVPAGGKTRKGDKEIFFLNRTDDSLWFVSDESPCHVNLVLSCKQVSRDTSAITRHITPAITRDITTNYKPHYT